MVITILTTHVATRQQSARELLEDDPGQSQVTIGLLRAKSVAN